MIIQDYTKKYKLLFDVLSFGLIMLLVFINLIQPFSFETAFGQSYVDKDWYFTTFKIDQFQYISTLIYTLSFAIIWHILKSSLGGLLGLLMSISFLFFITSHSYNHYESLLICPALLIYWAFMKLKGVSPIIISLVVISIWSSLSILFLLGSILTILLIKNKKDLKPGTDIKVISLIGILSILLCLFFYSKTEYIPSLTFANHFDLLATYKVSALIVIVSFLFSTFLFLAQKGKSLLSYLGFILSVLGFLFEGFHFLIPISIVFYLSVYSKKDELKSPWIYHLFIYLSCIATASTTVNNIPSDDRYFEVGITDEQKQIKQVLSPLKLNGNVFCSSTDKTEAQFYFNSGSNYTFLNLNEITSSNWSWLNFRMDNSINIVYFNLNNKIYDELIFLGEVLGDSEWALIYHTNRSKAILVRRELKFKSIIEKFEINKSALIGDQ